MSRGKRAELWLPEFGTGSADTHLSDFGLQKLSVKSKCSINKKGIRAIKRWVDEAIMEAMARRLAEHPEKVELRKCLVEHPFGTIKRAMNQGYFLMRGLSKVGAETSLTILAYNLRRVMNILGVRKMMEAVT